MNAYIIFVLKFTFLILSLKSFLYIKDCSNQKVLFSPQFKLFNPSLDFYYYLHMILLLLGNDKSTIREWENNSGN